MNAAEGITELEIECIFEQGRSGLTPITSVLTSQRASPDKHNMFEKTADVKVIAQQPRGNSFKANSKAKIKMKKKMELKKRVKAITKIQR